ncbi:GPI ethanolamine phosphate transferase 2 [Podospora australis]|uniref:GPI ethanolamine phosphate transferase 2 n=1 Tax=Podospora australis TaxID=1536484 RepID=A0AAN6X991_9PEZI|nr:GPI ethanolamine phosphate transferase 2 [Podospora australis]
MTPRQSRDGTLSSVLLLAANLLIPLAIYIFGAGFFPYKPLLSGFAEFSDDSHNHPACNIDTPAEAPFDKLVFMVIDALRSDFVYTENSGFKFTQSLIRDGAALPFTAHATSPTVTMPRLKAITTGSIPSFLDVVLNLDEGDESSSLASQDTWLAQMKRKGTGKLVMYGDDTWLKLFPGTFDRADGTTSFFVSDFTEVDNNVTRHIPEELKRADWNTMVLHYLGLDHIGHKGGPRSPYMIGKQQEMDDVVKTIYTAIESEEHLRSTLFVVLGDHGMNDAGNHGASSAGETSPALLLISPKIKELKKDLKSPLPEDESFRFYNVAEQSDIAPTLAALFGFPVPKNSLGALIPDILAFWPDTKTQARMLLRNAQQVMRVAVPALGPQILDYIEPGEPETGGQALTRRLMVLKSRCEDWGIDADGTVDLSETIRGLFHWLQDAQDTLSSMASNYNMDQMFLGQAASVAALILAAIAARWSNDETLGAFTPFNGILITYGVMMFASSYVEEEHHFWYWATTAWFGYLGLRGLKRGATKAVPHAMTYTALVLVTRVIRSWNQTGQKFAGEPDITKIFLHTTPITLWYLVGITYLWVHQNLVYGLSGFPVWLSFASATGLVLAAATFKIAFTLEDAPELVTPFVKKLLELNFTQEADLISRARALFIGLGILTATTIAYMLLRKRISVGQPGIYTLLSLVTLLLTTQSRTTNIPLFLLSNLQFRLLLSSLPQLSPVELTTSSLLLQHASFFAAGGSNAISSVDLSSAYNGVSEYSAPLVGVLTFISNWAGPLWWTVATTVLLLTKRAELQNNTTNLWKGHVAVLTVFVAGSAVAVMAACTVLRTHLFIWTVFSPKYLYAIAWSLGQHLLVNVGLGGVLYWLGVVEGGQ